MTRRKIGYGLTLIALAALLVFYSAALFSSSFYDGWAKLLLGFSLTLLPLLYLTPSVIRREGKSYAALALIAPIQLFFGGIIWLWVSALQGAWICFWAIILQIGTILHNYQKRQKKEKNPA